MRSQKVLRFFVLHSFFALILSAMLLPAPAYALDREPPVPKLAVGGESQSSVIQQAVVRYDRAAGTLDVRAEQSSFTALLTTIAEQSGMGIALGSGVSGMATVAFSGLSLEEGVKRIAEAAGIGNLAVEYMRVPGESGAAVFRVSKVTVLGNASSAGPIALGLAQASDPDRIALQRARVDDSARQRVNAGLPGTKGFMGGQSYPAAAGRGSAWPGMNGGQRRPALPMQAAQPQDLRPVVAPGLTVMRLAAPPLGRVVADVPGGLAAQSAAGRMLREQAGAKRPRFGKRLMR